MMRNNKHGLKWKNGGGGGGRRCKTMVYYTVSLVSVVRHKILMLGKHVDIVL